MGATFGFGALVAPTSRPATTAPAHRYRPSQAGAWISSLDMKNHELLEPISNAALAEIVGRHLDQHLVAGEHADSVLAHAARRMGDDLVFVFELDAEGRVRQQLRHDTGKFQKLFLCHSQPSKDGDGKRPARTAQMWRKSYRNRTSLTTST